MNQAFNWLSAHRRPIGYTIAALNIVGGVIDITNGNTVITDLVGCIYCC